MDQGGTWYFGREVSLRTSDVVLDGDPAVPSPKGHSPQFLAHVYCGQTSGWIKVPLGTEVGLGPGAIVLDGAPAPPERGSAPPPPNFGPSIVAKWSPISATAELWLTKLFLKIKR